jgi:hypothetical protein
MPRGPLRFRLSPQPCLTRCRRGRCSALNFTATLLVGLGEPMRRRQRSQRRQKKLGNRACECEDTRKSRTQSQQKQFTVSHRAPLLALLRRSAYLDPPASFSLVPSIGVVFWKIEVTNRRVEGGGPTQLLRGHRAVQQKSPAGRATMARGRRARARTNCWSRSKAVAARASPSVRFQTQSQFVPSLFLIRARHLRHKQAVRHPLLKVLDHCRFGSRD